MKISIITATWNSAATLADTLESVLSQTHTDIEHIIVDGLSTDRTMEIVRSYEPRYGGRLRWISERDCGLYDAMNKGIAMATGDVVGILNSDDFYASDHVLEYIAEASENADVVFGNLDFVSEKDQTKIVRTWTGSDYRPGAFQKGWHPAHPTFYAKKRFFDQLGGFDTSFSVSADFELMLRFIEKGKPITRYIPHVMVKMRLGGESTGSLRKIIEGNKNVIRAFHKNGVEVPPFYLVRRIWPKLVNMLKHSIIPTNRGGG